MIRGRRVGFASERPLRIAFGLKRPAIVADGVFCLKGLTYSAGEIGAGTDRNEAIE